MNYTFIKRNSNRYKGNLHSHTINSDGHLTPMEAKKLYKENGYSFLAFTDHEIYTDYRNELNDTDFIILPGIEASSNLVVGKRRKKNHHLLGILGTSQMQKESKKPIFNHLETLTPPIIFDEWDGKKEAQRLANELFDRGMIVTYNHPAWSRVDIDEFSELENVWGLEIYNYGTEIECALGFDTASWDKLLTNGEDILGFASDDNHNSEKLPDSLGGAIVVCTDKLTHDTIIKAILAGNYYSTSGVDIFEWGIKDEVVFISCSDVRKINFIVGGAVGDGLTLYCQGLDETINYGEYKLNGTEKYIRIECVDKYGHFAWTNPYFIGKNYENI